MPESITPMKAVTSAELPSDDDRWAHEVKWDGYRIIAFFRGGQVRLQTRNLLDATSDFPEVRSLTSALGARNVILDGEMVAMDERGHQSFSALQRRRLQVHQKPADRAGSHRCDESGNYR